MVSVECVGRVLERVVALTESELVVAELLPGSVLITTLSRSSGAMLDQDTVLAPWLNNHTTYVPATCRLPSSSPQSL